MNLYEFYLKFGQIHYVTSRKYSQFMIVYYESRKRELKRRLIYEYRCDERLKTKNEESTHLASTFIMNQERES